MKRKVIFLSVLLLACCFRVQAQDTIAFKPAVTYSFIKNQINFIHQAEALDVFFSQLMELKEQKPLLINILHLGDSHIQADYMTRTVRTLLQQEFGNAGLGLIFPGRVARTNETPLIHSSTSGKWESSRLTLLNPRLPMGIAGATIKTEKVNHSLTIKTTDPNYSFNRISLFFKKDFNSYNVSVKDSTGQELALAGAFTEESYHDLSKLVLPYMIDQVQLETVQSLPTQNQFTFFGISLSKSNTGLLYHIIASNGAQYRHFNLSKELLHQTPALAPDLIIISLGTNEAMDHPRIDPAFYSKIDTLVSLLKVLNPNATILLTTPPDFYQKRTQRNPGIQIIREKLITYAESNKLPYWDLHQVMGGHHAADRWKKAGLLQSDGIHFTKKGYDLQGHLLFEAIIKGYNEYVRNRFSKTH
jgi:lysophospholipase L1-like esterase